MITAAALSDLVRDQPSPARMPDAELLTRYAEQGSPHGPPVCLSFGETWNRAPAALTELLTTVPPHAHGYQLSLYGLGRLRQALRDHLVQTQGLDPAAADWEVAVGWTGTRSAMFDFGRLLVDRLARHQPDPAGRRPVVLVAGPSWDYAGVFEPLGLAVRYLPLRPEHGFAPRLVDLAGALHRLAGDGERLALLVVNAQHNPTAVNWSPDLVTAMAVTAVRAGAALLVDDAYAQVYDEGTTATPALDLVVRALRAEGAVDRLPWLGVRSLGKQFGCNGWGVGVLTAHPALLRELVEGYRLHHGLMHAGPLQYAMAEWLTDPASTDFLATQRKVLAETRAAAAGAFRTRLGYPAEAVHPGSCTPYLLVRLPPAYAALADGEHRFRADCFAATGVLLAPAWPWPFPAPDSGATPLPYLRVYLGPVVEPVLAAVERMAAAGLGYRAEPAG